jgi:hypothetical protein
MCKFENVQMRERDFNGIKNMMACEKYFGLVDMVLEIAENRTDEHRSL